MTDRVAIYTEINPVYIKIHTGNKYDKLNSARMPTTANSIDILLH